jgi:hydrogenase/urease accessory protein HupE
MHTGGGVGSGLTMWAVLSVSAAQPSKSAFLFIYFAILGFKLHLEPLHQPFFVKVFFVVVVLRSGLVNLIEASNLDPPDLCPLSS